MGEEEKMDYLEVDDQIPGQNYVCLSFVSPDQVLNCEECDKCPCDKCDKCKSKTKVLRKVSFVDAPGHESLMATMLSGANVMDGALLLVSANESCPQPQTREHLMALEISQIEKIVVVQNKIDLVTSEKALKN